MADKNQALVKALLNLTSPKIDNSKMVNQLKGFPQGMGSKQGVYNLPADYNVKNEIKDAALFANSFAPVTGDIQSGVMAVQDLVKGDYGNAALNAVGMLPFVAGMGGTLKVPKLQEAAKQHFGTTFYPQETGYIMDDLSRLDLTGRHQASGYRNVAGRYIPEAGQPDYLKMERSVDHREVAPLLPAGTESGWNTLSKFIDDTGAIRYDSNYGISLVNTNKPNAQQIEKVVNDFRRSKTPLIIDVDRTSDGQNLASKEFEIPTVEQVKRWINKQYK
jgi:hypothetical protein